MTKRKAERAGKKALNKEGSRYYNLLGLVVLASWFIVKPEKRKSSG